MIDSIVDTLINVLVFVFIGLMIWLYVQNAPDQNGGEGE